MATVQQMLKFPTAFNAGTKIESMCYLMAMTKGATQAHIAVKLADFIGVKLAPTVGGASQNEALATALRNTAAS